MHQVRVLLDSGANLSLINNDVARKIGLPGDTVNINLNVAGEGLSLDMLPKEVTFQLVSMNKSFVSKPMYAVTTSSMDNPFNRVTLTQKGMHIWKVSVPYPYMDI